MPIIRDINHIINFKESQGEFGYIKHLVVNGSLKMIPAQAFFHARRIHLALQLLQNNNHIQLEYFDTEVLASVKIPPGVKGIGPEAFRDCKSLSIVLIPESLEIMAKNCFKGCDRLDMIFIDTEDELEFRRIQSLLPQGLQHKAIFGTKLYNKICEMKKNTLDLLSHNFLKDLPERDLEKMKEQYLSFINAVTLPSYDDKNYDHFVSAYQGHLNTVIYRIRLSMNLNQSMNLSPSSQSLMRSIVERIETYEDPLVLSMKERFFITFREEWFLSFFKNAGAFLEDRQTYNFITNPQFVALVKSQQWKKWFADEEKIRKLLRHDYSKLEHFAHFFTDPQWEKEIIDFFKGSGKSHDFSKVEGFFDQENPMYQVIYQFLKNHEQPNYSILGAIGGIFSSKEKRGQKEEEKSNRILNIFILVELCFTLELSYKKEALLKIKNPNILVQNLRVLKDIRRYGRVNVYYPEMILLLEKLKKMDIHDIPPALWTESFSYTKEECARLNAYIEENNQAAQQPLGREYFFEHEPGMNGFSRAGARGSQKTFSENESIYNFFDIKYIINFERSLSENQGFTHLVVRDGVSIIPFDSFSNDRDRIWPDPTSSHGGLGKYYNFYTNILTSLEIPRSVKNIGSDCFCGCHNLSIVVLPGSLESIGRNCFQNCSSLHMVFIDAADKSEFDRVQSLLPEGLKDKAIFGKKLFNRICDMRQCSFGILLHNFFEKSSIMSEEKMKESFWKILDAVPLPPYDGKNDDIFASAYQEALSALPSRYRLERGIYHFHEHPFMRRIEEKVQNYKKPICLSVEERFFVTIHHNLLLEVGLQR